VIASIISVFAVLSILTVMLTFLLGVTRVWFSMSRDGLLPPWFAGVDRRGTPQRVTWVAGIASAVLAGVFPIRAVADLTNIGILSAFVVVCVAVILFRYTRPDTPRSFRLPLMPRRPRVRRPGVAVPHLPAARDLAALRRLAGHRAGALRDLRPPARAAEPGQPAAPARGGLPAPRVSAGAGDAGP
jgi:hypothetical protein